MSEQDIKELTALNLAYLHSDEYSDVARYEEMLTEDFHASLADYRLLNRKEFLDMIAKPRPFTELQCQDVKIRVLPGNEFALIHARMTYRTKSDGVVRHGRYTDEYQKRNGKWMCVGGNVIAEKL